MNDSNKTYRIRTEVGGKENSLHVKLDQNYDTFEILSLKLNEEGTYKLHNAEYGVIVGRAIANGGFGVPNAKISVFIEADGDINTIEMSALYPFTKTTDENSNGQRYNLLPDNDVEKCHKHVGSFPNKTYMLDNDILIEIFDTYYKYTTRTNNSGDYMICGVPLGNHTLHMDLDLSDCGILSQRPRDFVYKGYTIEQFENPNQFKDDGDIKYLSQIFSQDQIVNVIPFWGNEELGETIGITRADININFKFEPTCIFMGSVVSDAASNGVSQKCVPTNQMGAMDELTTGQGYIEMIRKTPGGNVEEFQVKGTQVIDANGVWCYQIPMNLDYMMTDEYGNMVPTDNPDKGIPTRTRVRFRLSMNDFDNNDGYFRGKTLIPNNPQVYVGSNAGHEDYDYNFGDKTRDDSYRDLFWNNVYTVKSYIPRFQQSQSWRTERFAGIKHSNIYGQNNPLPYNNIRIKMPLMFTILCALIKSYIRIVDFINQFEYVIVKFIDGFASNSVVSWVIPAGIRKACVDAAQSTKYTIIKGELCPDLDSWYFAPCKKGNCTGIIEYAGKNQYNVLNQTFNDLNENEDSTSIDSSNGSDNKTSKCLTTKVDYLLSCIEMNLAQEYKVINFDFYNDWINGVIYLPRWKRQVRPKQTYLFGLIKLKEKIKACVSADSDGNTTVNTKTRKYVQQCALTYKWNQNKGYTSIMTPAGCVSNTGNGRKKQKCHLANGKKIHYIFGSSNGGFIRQTLTSQKQYVYYYKPCEWGNGDKKTLLYANDLVLLGSLNDCSLYGIPQAYKYMSSSSYKMPTNLALTNMDEESYVYNSDDGTICSGQKEDTRVTRGGTSYSDISVHYDSVTTTDGSVDVIHYGTKDNNTDERSTGNVPENDNIAVTEAAGIAWNYTGPQQGEKDDNPAEGLYMPGGHFLGISCVNSETNIKSCVNLQRICEMGVSMSQRREVVREIKKDGDVTTISYKYYVPTGLISDDEITDNNFRSMFATLNMKRLIADKKDKETNYPIYSFIYNKPDGFDGSISKYAVGKYNESLQGTDEWETMKEDMTFLQSQGSLINTAQTMDEINNTQRRTIESYNRDYYMFRMGLNDNTIKSKVENDKRFIFTSNGASLPQYENSFYFYFGLKEGATALDELYRQFFSECGAKQKVSKPNAVVSRDPMSYCNLKGHSAVSIKNMGKITTDNITVIDTNTNVEEDFIEGKSVNGVWSSDAKTFTPSTTGKDNALKLIDREKYFLEGSLVKGIWNGNTFIENENGNDYAYKTTINNGATIYYYSIENDESAKYGKLIVKNTYFAFYEETEIEFYGLGNSKYKVIVKDEENIEYTFDIDYRQIDPEMNGSIISNDFIVKTDKLSQSTVEKERYNDIIAAVKNNPSKIGGYFAFEGNFAIKNITGGTIRELSLTGTGVNKAYIKIVSQDNYFVTNDTSIYDSKKLNYELFDSNKVCLWRMGTYNIYVGYECDSKVVMTYFDTINVNGLDGLNLYMGSSELSYSDILSKLPVKWWMRSESELGSLLYKAGITDSDERKDLLWALKHYSFNQNVDGETFSSGIICNNEYGGIGKSIMFGQPENVIEPFKKSELVNSSYIFSETDSTEYTGYDIDDDASIRCTYPFVISDRKDFFGKMAYNNNDEMLSEGVPVIIETAYTTTTSTGSKVTTLKLSIQCNLENYIYDNTTGTTKRFIVGHGCVLQVKGLNDVYPLVASSTELKIYGVFDEEKLYTFPISDAKCYPLFFYPVIKREFYCKMNYITLPTSTLEIVTGATEPYGNYYISEKTQCQGTIYNGIVYPVTVSNYGNVTRYFTFNSASTINGVSIIGENGVPKIYDKNTTSGLYLNNEYGNAEVIRELTFNGTSFEQNINSSSESTEYSYEIIEGAPSDYKKYDLTNTELKTLSFNIASPFTDSITQVICDDGKIRYKKESSNNDKNVVYKLISTPSFMYKGGDYVFDNHIAPLTRTYVSTEVESLKIEETVNACKWYVLVKVNGHVEVATCTLNYYFWDGESTKWQILWGLFRKKQEDNYFNVSLDVHFESIPETVTLSLNDVPSPEYCGVSKLPRQRCGGCITRDEAEKVDRWFHGDDEFVAWWHLKHLLLKDGQCVYVERAFTMLVKFVNDIIQRGELFKYEVTYFSENNPEIAAKYTIEQVLPVFYLITEGDTKSLIGEIESPYTTTVFESGSTKTISDVVVDHNKIVAGYYKTIGENGKDEITITKLFI